MKAVIIALFIFGGSVYAASPAITAVLNAASYQPGIVAGSWVMIEGTNLSNTTRTWTKADFAGNRLPTALDGVSVTINGNPAFVYYISPNQINVQAPSDGTVGPVNVVVNNNGAVTAPATAQLQIFAPAFFQVWSTNYALVTRLPDYALIGDPSAINSAVPAQPGDFLMLWGTGFGPTQAPMSAGIVVSGTPPAAAASPVTVTVGGVSAPVLFTFLTPGSVGLYQVTFQLPANVPAGAVPIQASIGGVQSPAGTMIFVAGQ